MVKKTKQPDITAEELIQVLKFTPRTYKIMIQGYGGEAYAGTVDRKVYDFFKKHQIDIGEYASDWDDQFVSIPREFQPFNPGNPYDCENLFHCSGAELSEMNEITVYDENDNEHWTHNCGYNDLQDAGIAVNESDGCDFDDLPEETVVFWGGQGEKGCFFDGEIELTEPFDPKKLTINYTNCDGWYIIDSVEYAGESIDGSGGYSTTGKWTENKWILCNGEDVYEPVSIEDHDGNLPWNTEPASACTSETWDPAEALEKIELPVTDWFPKDIKPVHQGEYECEFEIPTWPWPAVRMCTWTGRSWKDTDGERVKGNFKWRGLTEEMANGN